MGPDRRPVGLGAVGDHHVIDRFHVARWFASGLIEIRRRIQRIGPKGSRPAYHPEIFRSRYLQLRRADRLEPEARTRLERILTTDPDLAQAWELYQAVHRIYLAEDNEQANEALGEFLDRHYQRSLPEFEPLLDTLLRWGDEIFAFHDTDRAHQRPARSTNAKLGVLKSRLRIRLSPQISATEPYSSPQEWHHDPTETRDPSHVTAQIRESTPEPPENPDGFRQ